MILFIKVYQIESSNNNKIFFLILLKIGTMVNYKRVVINYNHLHLQCYKKRTMVIQAYFVIKHVIFISL